MTYTSFFLFIFLTNENTIVSNISPCLRESTKLLFIEMSYALEVRVTFLCLCMCLRIFHTNTVRNIQVRSYASISESLSD